MKKNFRKAVAALLALATLFCQLMPVSYAVNEAYSDGEIESVSVAPVISAVSNETVEVIVTAIPADVSEGRFVVASLEDGSNAEIRNSELIFNADGEAKFEIKALAAESFKVSFDVADSTLSAETVVAVNSIGTAAVDDPDVVEVTDIKINQSSAVLLIGNALELSANVLPSDATNKNIIWTSSKKSVATVDSNGVVTPVSKGNVWIIATSEDGGFNAICNVTVKRREFTVTWNVDGTKTSERYEEGAIINKPSNPSKKGYTFIGWSPEVPSVMPSKDIEFVAKFREIEVDPTVRISILPSSRRSISYGDTLGLRCSVSGTLPTGAIIVWQDDVKDLVELDVEYGERVCNVKPIRHGSTPIRVKVLVGDRVLAEDYVVIQSNANFFYRVIGTIKIWLGLTIRYS